MDSQSPSNQSIYQMFINKLYTRREKWNRYKDVLTNEECFNVNNLKKKYNIQETIEEPTNEDQSNTSVIEQAGRVPQAPQAPIKPQKEEIQMHKSVLQPIYDQNNPNNFLQSVATNLCGKTDKKVPVLERRKTELGSRKNSGLIEVYCGRKHTTI